jgi:hypothetical protein
MALFQPGQGGRMKGSRNLLSKAFIDALAKEFQEHGPEAIRIVRIERPHEFLKVVASLLPKEFEITTSNIREISDDELDRFIELARVQLGRPLTSINGREEQAADREPVKLLSSVSETT